MSYWQHAPREVQARLIELAELFAGLRAIYFDLIDENRWTPRAGSGAASDLQDLPPAGTLTEGTPMASGFHRVADVMSAYLLIAAGHLGGLAALHASEEVMFPSGMLVRGVIENCSHVFWVLGPGDTESPTSKLARAFLEEDLSAEEAKKNAGRLGSKDGETYAQAAASWKQLRAEILARFPDATSDSLGKRQLAGQQFLNPEKCVQSMYEFLETRTAASIDARVGQGVYGYLSNVTHPTLYPVRELRDWRIEAENHGGHATAVNVLPVEFLERQASVAAVCFFNTVSYVTSYFGWPVGHYERMADLLKETLPGAITH
jgi:hypothetical protein